MTIALKMSSTACPVVLKEEVEMVGLGVEDAVGEDVDEVAEGFFQSRVFPDAEEVGVRLDDMQVSVLLLGIVGIEV